MRASVGKAPGLEGLPQTLICPVTHSTLRYDAARQAQVSKEAGPAFPIRNRIPVMLVDEARVREE